MNRLFHHLADIVETANGGFDMTRKGRQYFSRFLRQHGKTLREIKTHDALVEALRECTAADFALARRRMHLTPLEEDAAMVGNESLHRLVA